VTLDEFDRLFDVFEASAFHLETHQHYAVSEEDERLRAFRQGLPRPERSVRTTPWLRRIAVSTATEGKRWCRVHLIEHPLTEYLRYQLVGYIESQAAGEEIRLADRRTHSDLADLGPDSWLFDAGTANAFGVVLHFDRNGHLIRIEQTDNVRELERQRETALARSLSLAEFLAPHRDV